MSRKLYLFSNSRMGRRRCFLCGSLTQAQILWMLVCESRLCKQHIEIKLEAYQIWLNQSTIYYRAHTSSGNKMPSWYGPWLPYNYERENLLVQVHSMPECSSDTIHKTYQCRKVSSQSKIDKLRGEQDRGLCTCFSEERHDMTLKLGIFLRANISSRLYSWWLIARFSAVFVLSQQ